MTITVNRFALLSILLVIFLDFFNLGLIYPIFSSLIFEGSALVPSNASELYKNGLFGTLIAVFPFGQFFGAPIIGQLSDHYGRKKLLVFSLVGTVFTLLLGALGLFLTSMITLLLARFIGGLMAGNLTLAYATLADFSSEKDKVRNFALLPFTASAGFALGPLLSGLLTNPQISPWPNPLLPFLVAALFSLVNLLLVMGKFPETFIPLSGKQQIKFYTGITNLSKIFRKTRHRPYLWMLFLMISANFLFVQFAGPFATEKFHLTITGLSYLYTNIGLGAALGNLFLTRYLAHYFSAENAFAKGLIALFVLLIVFIFSYNIAMVHIMTFLIMLACAIGYTNSMALVSNLERKEKQGEMMGIAVSLQSCAEFLPAFLVGFVASLSENIAIITAAGCAAVSFIILRSLKELHVSGKS